MANNHSINYRGYSIDTGEDFEYLTLIDSFQSNVALIDENGFIVATNKAWQDFAILNRLRNPEALGENYFQIVDRAKGYSADKAKEASNGIRSLLKGKTNKFTIDYPCHSKDKERWCRMQAFPISKGKPWRVVLSHEDITKEKQMEFTIAGLQYELNLQRSNSETLDTAYKVLLKRRDEDKRELEEKVLANIKEVVTPYLAKLQRSNLDPEQKRYLTIIRANLEGVTAPFVHQLSSKFFNLSSREINVANFILEGRGTKEIADILCISSNAIEFHRKNIRRKLGIKNKRVSLRSRLLSLEPNCIYQQFGAWKSDVEDPDNY
jgi:PAS domain S-box-containing protein